MCGAICRLRSPACMAWSCCAAWGRPCPMPHRVTRPRCSLPACWPPRRARSDRTTLPFAFAGLYGLVVLRGVGPAMPDAASRASATLFFAGLLCTAAGSAVYHWQPQDAGLLWDRLGMVLPFAGLLGLTAANRVSERSGWAVAAAVLLAGPLALLWWSYRGNLLPWAVVQFGGMSVVFLLSFLPPRAGALALYPGAVIALYALAKLFEAADHAVFGATAQWVSGHSLKHVLAAGAAWPVLSALA